MERDEGGASRSSSRITAPSVGGFTGAMGVESPTGKVIGGFRVGELLSRGAMGAVYIAEDADGRRVALKLLSPELLHDDRFRRRFLRESRLAAALDHPNVVKTIAAGEDGGVLYLAMDYVDGVDLRELLRHEGRLAPERAVALVAQAGEALDAAHAAGLVHRDVKPGNVLVASGADGERAYVCDFGVARHVGSVGSLTGDRGFVGTVDYVAPEQIRGEEVDGRADVYALGCVLFECVSGERPFERENELAVVFAHLNEPPPRVTDVRPGLAAGWDGVVARALAKEPKERYASCRDLAAAASDAMHGRVMPSGRSRRRIAIAAVALAAAGATVGTVLAFRDDPPTAKTAAEQPLVLRAIDASTGAGARKSSLGHEVRLGGGALRCRRRRPLGVASAAQRTAPLAHRHPNARTDEIFSVAMVSAAAARGGQRLRLGGAGRRHGARPHLDRDRAAGALPARPLAVFGSCGGRPLALGGRRGRVGEGRARERNRRPSLPVRRQLAG